ncbi:monovalent cation/H(+) antiporter subunit G [Oleisolibacter albus]|uniref:monovalent cation/H(+) antiporter subunit G n=1 Tax=Oleisolibacter albus TaxID=2171757 RepID=UPI000DF1CD0D|nr:monovalent cation/H(+) antiporter subunit G [Oleisolibacter albus]
MTDLLQILAGLLVLGGACFCFVAALGIVRLPDPIMRMHASSKAGTVGCGLILLSVALHFPEGGVMARALAAIAFLLISTPVAAHMIGRAAYACGVELCAGTIADELKDTKDNPRRLLLGQAGPGVERTGGP